MKRWRFSVLAVLLLPAMSAAAVRVVDLGAGVIVPAACTGKDGVLHVAYVQGNDLYYIRSGDGGATFSTPLRVNSEPGFVSGGMFRGPDLAVDSAGRVHVIWYNDGYRQKRPPEQWGVMYARLDPDSAAFSRSRNLGLRPSDNYSLAVGPSGQVAVLWTAGGLFARLSTDSGTTFGPASQIEPQTVDPCECCATRAMYTPQGELLALYRDKRDNVRDMYLLSGKRTPGQAGTFERLRVSGEAWPINACPMTGSFLSLKPEGGLMAAWETRAHIRAAELGPAGNPTVGQRLEAATVGKYPLLLCGPDSSLLVAWKHGKMLEWKLYRSVADSSPQAGSRETDNGDRPAGAVNRQGDFLLFP